MSWTRTTDNHTTQGFPNFATASDRDEVGGKVWPRPRHRNRQTRHWRVGSRSRLLAAMTGALLLPGPAGAQDKVPSAVSQEILIKASLLTLNDANVTGNYDVLHAKLAKPFREQFSPERLKQSFKPFVDQKIDWEVIVAKSPIATKEAQIDDRGALLLRGYFDVSPTRVIYDLDFLPSEGEWKPIKLNVNVKPAKE
jgi:hypothetical protein